jgi:hypothetical protein
MVVFVVQVNFRGLVGAVTGFNADNFILNALSVQRHFEIRITPGIGQGLLDEDRFVCRITFGVNTKEQIDIAFSDGFGFERIAGAASSLSAGAASSCGAGSGVSWQAVMPTARISTSIAIGIFPSSFPELFLWVFYKLSPPSIFLSGKR